MDIHSQDAPKARVNITLDLETNGVKLKKELPLKLVLLGDFSRGQSQQPLAQRQRITINQHNFNEVLASLSPTLEVGINSHNTQDVDTKAQLTFQHMQDFHPQQIAMQVPKLKKLIAMRHLLKELRSHILEDANLRSQLHTVLKNPDARRRLQEELRQLITINAE